MGLPRLRRFVRPDGGRTARMILIPASYGQAMASTGSGPQRGIPESAQCRKDGSSPGPRRKHGHQRGHRRTGEAAEEVSAASSIDAVRRQVGHSCGCPSEQADIEHEGAAAPQRRQDAGRFWPFGGTGNVAFMSRVLRDLVGTRGKLPKGAIRNKSLCVGGHQSFVEIMVLRRSSATTISLIIAAARLNATACPLQ